MAKRNMINRELKRIQLVARYAKKRAALKETIRNPESTPEEKFAAVESLQKLPRDSSKSRIRNRCKITGRSRGVYKKFGLARHKLREAPDRRQRRTQLVRDHGDELVAQPLCILERTHVLEDTDDRVDRSIFRLQGSGAGDHGQLTPVPLGHEEFDTGDRLIGRE